MAVPFRLTRTPGGLRLHGRADFAPDAADADRLLLLAEPAEDDAVTVIVDVDPRGQGRFPAMAPTATASTCTRSTPT